MGSTSWCRVAYVVLFAFASLLSTWPVTVAGVVVLPGSVAMVFAYGLLDVVNNAAGPRVARLTVAWAAAARATVFAAGWVAAWRWPALRERMWASVALFVAAEAAMVLSQWCVDVPVFDYVKRHLKLPFWVRYNVSNLVSQPLAAVILSAGAAWALNKPYWAVLVGALSVRVFLFPVLLTPVYSTWQR